MCSLNFDSLFTNIPLEETIKISANYLFKKNIVHLMFNNTLYKQINEVAMGSQLGSSLANAFLA